MITARAVDAAGNASGASAGLTVRIDATAPGTPAAPALAAGSDTGVSASDGLTSDNEEDAGLGYISISGGTFDITSGADAIEAVTDYDRFLHGEAVAIGMTAAAKNGDNATKLMEYLVGQEAQQWYAEVNHEYPVIADVEWSDILRGWGEFRADTLNLSKLGELNADAVRLMDRAGWK